MLYMKYQAPLFGVVHCLENRFEDPYCCYLIDYRLQYYCINDYNIYIYIYIV